MKKFVWQDEGGESVDQTIMEFMAGEDVVLDRELFPFDIDATAAHVRGLSRIGIVSAEESNSLCQLLEQLKGEFESGDFVLDDRYEDGHSAIEMYLTEKTGDTGARVHTGRSRNDQVAVATRLFLRASLQKLAGLCAQLARACLERAERQADIPMPGYTHLQRAVPSSVGLWMAGFAEAFSDNLAFTGSVLELIDCSPLGTAAGYGVNLPLDRDGVASDLGFGRLQVNPLYTQNSRGKFEIMALQAASHAMQDLRRFAWDLSLFTTSEFNFVTLPAQYVTGSSIMPNKANPDVVELLRGRAATVEAAVHEIQSVLSLPSGYQRDLQLTKAPLIRGIKSALQALAIAPALIRGLQFNEDKMRKSISLDMFLTDMAQAKAATGIPFRTAYLEAKKAADETGEMNAAASLAERVSPGACGDLQLDRIRIRLEQQIQALGEAESGA